MTVNLPKGGNVPLTSVGIDEVRVELGWNAAPGTTAPEIDGVVALARGGTHQVLLSHEAPNPTEGPATALAAPAPGGGGGEALVVTLTAIPADVTLVQLGALIYDGTGRGDTFRAVRGARIRVVDPRDASEIARFEVEPETGHERALIFGELYRHSSGWKFRAVGQGFTNGLAGFGPAATAVGAPEVADFLRRTTPTRSRRRIADHQRRAAAVPTAVRASPPPAPTGPAAPPAAAHRAPLDLDAPTLRPRTPAPPPSPVSSSPLDLGGGDHRHPSPPAAGRSPLDLGVGESRPPTSGPLNLGPPARGHSPLDLGGSEPPPPAAAPDRSSQDLGLTTRPAAVDSVRRRPAPGDVVFGERSSRYRQRLERVTALDDTHPVTAWTAEKRGSGALTVTLRWTQLTTRTGLPRPSDLQVGCLWQALDGSAGLLQTTGGGSAAPGLGGGRQVLALAPRDEREGQKIFVDLRSLATFKRFFVFAYGLRGAPEWDGLRPELTVVARTTGEHLLIKLGPAPAGARTCLIASFHLAQDDLLIRRENTYLFGPQADLAQEHGWALDWSPDGMTLREP